MGNSVVAERRRILRQSLNHQRHADGVRQVAENEAGSAGIAGSLGPVKTPHNCADTRTTGIQSGNSIAPARPVFRPPKARGEARQGGFENFESPA